jgi:hypothetical protein
VNASQVCSPAEAHQEQLRKQAEACFSALRAVLLQPPAVRSAADLQQTEEDCAKCCDELLGALIGVVTQAALDTSEMGERAQRLARSAPKRLKRADARTVGIQFQRGPKVKLRCDYYRRRPGDARHREKGLFPAFVLLGIHTHVSPGAAGQMARCACAVGSLDEAATWLRDSSGLDANVKTIRTVTRGFGQRARAALPTQAQQLEVEGQGRRLVISVDGGRLRIRKDKPGARTAKGRRRYHSDWREPLLLHIYALDENGRLDRSFNPLIDGTLGGIDALFELLRLYLPLLITLQPTHILLIADGARSIWKRFDKLVADGILGSARIIQLIDFYHAVEHLGAFAEACSHYDRARRTRWRNQTRGLLRAGKLNSVLADMDRIIAAHPRNTTLKTERNYFHRNRLRFSYAWARRLHLPIGSGPMESAIRRVINLRLKGPGIFWHEENAEAMILIRSFYKAHRWDEVRRCACNPPLEALL